MTPSDDVIAAVLTALALERGRGKSFCPSEAAKTLAAKDAAADWRALMPLVRKVATSRPDLVATQKGAAVDAATAKGPIRLTLR